VEVKSQNVILYLSFQGEHLKDGFRGKEKVRYSTSILTEGTDADRRRTTAGRGRNQL